VGNPVVHFDVNGPDPEATATFYAELFGWQPEPIPDQGYWLIHTHSPRGIDGGFGRTAPGTPPYVTFYVEAEDLPAVLDRAESLGGKTISPVVEIPNMVTFAEFADPEGNVIGLIESAQGEGEPHAVVAVESPRVEWFEVLGADPPGLWQFYRDLFDWRIKEPQSEGLAYGEVDTGAGRGISGGIGSSPDGQSHVNLYVGVEDPQEYLDRAERLGGGTLMPPTTMADQTTIALFQDPQGTAFGVFNAIG
jgi:uncharacterized protein